MSDAPEPTHLSYPVPAEVWRKTRLAGAAGIGLGLVIVVIAVIAAGAENADGTVALAGLLFGLLVAAIGGTALVGSGRVAALKYELTVVPEALIVGWAGYSTVMRWDDLEYARFVSRGPATVYLNVRPRTGFSIPPRTAGRRPALPQPSGEHPGELRAFVLSMLGASMGDAMAEIRKHLPLEEGGSQET